MTTSSAPIVTQALNFAASLCASALEARPANVNEKVDTVGGTLEKTQSLASGDEITLQEGDPAPEHRNPVVVDQRVGNGTVLPKRLVRAAEVARQEQEAFGPPRRGEFLPTNDHE